MIRSQILFKYLYVQLGDPCDSLQGMEVIRVQGCISIFVLVPIDVNFQSRVAIRSGAVMPLASCLLQHVLARYNFGSQKYYLEKKLLYYRI